MLPICTQRILIRPLTLSDAEAVFAYRSDPAVTRYQMWRPSEIIDVQRFIRDQSGMIPGMPGIWFQMGIVLQGSAELVGDCGILVSMDDPASAELGLTLRTDAQRKGYATEALSALIEYCFVALHMSRVLARVFSGNLRAMSLVEHSGFTFTGRISSKLIDGTAGDDLFYILEQRNWQAQSRIVTTPG